MRHEVSTPWHLLWHFRGTYGSVISRHFSTNFTRTASSSTLPHANIHPTTGHSRPPLPSARTQSHMSRPPTAPLRCMHLTRTPRPALFISWHSLSSIVSLPPNSELHAMYTSVGTSHVRFRPPQDPFVKARRPRFDVTFAKLFPAVFLKTWYRSGGPLPTTGRIHYRQEWDGKVEGLRLALLDEMTREAPKCGARRRRAGHGRCLVGESEEHT